MRRSVSLVVAAFAVLSSLCAASARAEEVVQQTNVQAAPEPDPPSIFASGYQGMLAGALVGLGGGYLAGRRGGWRKQDWRPVGLGLGIGALAGAGLGITLGIMDRSGMVAGRYIARDLFAGAGFGALVGAIAGGISAIVQNEAEHVLFGTAIGVVSGAALGIVTGIVEGQTKKDRMRGAAAKSAPPPRVKLEPSVVATRFSFMPGVRGRF